MRILCMGDSLTYGYDVAPVNSWTSLVAAALALDIHNQGLCGDTTGGMLFRLRQQDLMRYDAFFLMGGSNDILLNVPIDHIQSHMEKMAVLLQRQEKPVFIGIPPLTLPESAHYGWQESFAVDRHNEELSLYRDWLYAYCHTFDFTPVDFYQILAEAAKETHLPLYADGVHPNERGYALLAKEAGKAFKTLMK